MFFFDPRPLRFDCPSNFLANDPLAGLLTALSSGTGPSSDGSFPDWYFSFFLPSRRRNLFANPFGGLASISFAAAANVAVVSVVAPDVLADMPPLPLPSPARIAAFTLAFVLALLLLFEFQADDTGVVPPPPPPPPVRSLAAVSLRRTPAPFLAPAPSFPLLLRLEFVAAWNVTVTLAGVIGPLLPNSPGSATIFRFP